MNKNLKSIIEADLYRNTGNKRISMLYFWGKDYSTCSFLIKLRKCNYHFNNRNKSVISKVLFPYYKYLWKKSSVKLGIEIDYRSSIGRGLRLPHRGGIVVHKDAVIGDNCEIMQCVTIGNNLLKSRDAVATIGNGTILCAGCKIIGSVQIGNNVVVGANAVVSKNLPDNCIAAGVPAAVIKTLSDNVAINTDY